MINSFTIGIFLLLSGFGNTSYIDGNDGKGCAYQCFAYTGFIRTHSEAQDNCDKLGGTLVVPDTAATMEYLRTLCNVQKEIHVGGDESTTPTITPCKNNNGDYKRKAQYCHGKCFCKNKYYGDICEFTKPVIESCHIHPNSTDSVFPLNITCIITGFPVNEKTILQWKADGNILPNNTDDVVFYRDDVSIVKGIATLVLKRGICLGSLEIKLVVTQTFNAKPLTPNAKAILINSNFDILSNVRTDAPSCNGSITNVQCNSNIPSHIQAEVKYNITTLPETHIVSTIRKNFTLPGLKPKTDYVVKIVATASSSKFCSNSNKQQTMNLFITTGFDIPIAIFNGEIHAMGDFLCKVSWSHSNPKNVESYKILIKGEISHVRNNVTFPTYKDEVAITSANKTSYWARTMPPNKKYSFEIYASNCAGNGPTVKLKGICSTPTQAPSMIHKPTLFMNKVDKNGKIEIIVNPVNEENGIVKCLLVVLTTKLLQSNDTLLTQDQFTEMTNTIGYIAYCNKDVSSITKVTLGGSEPTYCYLGIGANVNMLTHDVLVGDNDPLEVTKSHMIYVVSVSRSDSGWLYRRSESVLLTGDIDYTVTIIIVSVVLGVAILSISGLVIVKKSRSHEFACRMRSASGSNDDIQLETNTIKSDTKEGIYMIPVSNALDMQPTYENI